MTDPTLQPTSDHDLLIRLDVKLQRVSDDIQDLKQGISTRLNSVEKQVADNTQWIHDFKLTWKTILALASAIGAMVGGAMTILVQIMHVFGK